MTSNCEGRLNVIVLCFFKYLFYCCHKDFFHLFCTSETDFATILHNMFIHWPDVSNYEDKNFSHTMDLSDTRIYVHRYVLVTRTH